MLIQFAFFTAYALLSMFPMLVVLAVVSTLMTGPLLQWLLQRIGHRPGRVIEA